MTRRKRAPATEDPAVEALACLSGKWTPIVLLTLQRLGPTRFNQLLTTIPDISSKVLTETLKSVRSAGLVERQELSETPLRVEYELTPAGRELESVFRELRNWRERN